MEHKARFNLDLLMQKRSEKEQQRAKQRCRPNAAFSLCPDLRTVVQRASSCPARKGTGVTIAALTYRTTDFFGLGRHIASPDQFHFVFPL